MCTLPTDRLQGLLEFPCWHSSCTTTKLLREVCLLPILRRRELDLPELCLCRPGGGKNLHSCNSSTSFKHTQFPFMLTDLHDALFSCPEPTLEDKEPTILFHMPPLSMPPLGLTSLGNHKNANDWKQKNCQTERPCHPVNEDRRIPDSTLHFPSTGFYQQEVLP